VEGNFFWKTGEKEDKEDKEDKEKVKGENKPRVRGQ